jgi:DivIVA domain-containing protein
MGHMAYARDWSGPVLSGPHEEVPSALRPTPEEIEARRFRLAQNGYDCEAVDRFLAEIADGLRTEPAPSSLDPDEFGRLGQEIAAILRNAHDAAGAVKAEAEGQAAALRATAEAEAHDIRKATQGESDAIKALATIEADAERAAARAEAEALRAKAESDAAQMRADADRLLGQAAATRAAADRDVAAKLEHAEHEAQRRSTEIMADAERRASEVREREQSTYLRLLGARDDVQHALDRLATHVGIQHEDPVVDLTTAPAQVRPLTDIAVPAVSSVDTAGGRPAPASAPEPPGSTAADGAVAFDIDRESVGPTQLDATGGTGPADPLLRMVRAAVGRAVEASTEANAELPTDEIGREASAS